MTAVPRRQHDPAPGTDPAGESVGWQVTGNLLSTALIGGGAGYGLDRLLGTHFIVGIGLVVSMALTLYYLWLRYGTH